MIEGAPNFVCGHVVLACNGLEELRHAIITRTAIFGHAFEVPGIQAAMNVGVTNGEVLGELGVMVEIAGSLRGVPLAIGVRLSVQRAPSGKAEQQQSRVQDSGHESIDTLERRFVP